MVTVNGDMLIVSLGCKELQESFNERQQKWEEYTEWVNQSLYELCQQAKAPHLADDMSFLPTTTPRGKKGGRKKKRRPTLVVQAAVRSSKVGGKDESVSDTSDFHSILNQSEMNSTNLVVKDTRPLQVTLSEMNVQDNGKLKCDNGETYARNSHGSFTKLTDEIPVEQEDVMIAEMTELSVNEGKQKQEDGEDWLTDDESVSEDKSSNRVLTTKKPNNKKEPFKNILLTPPSKTPVKPVLSIEKGFSVEKSRIPKQTPIAVAKTPNTSITEKETQSFATKANAKKKESQYFTPSAFVPRSTRANTRAISRVVPPQKIQSTPGNGDVFMSAKQSAAKNQARIKQLTKQMKDSVQSSGGSTTSTDGPRAGGSTVRSMRSVSRVKGAPNSAAKELTESAQKRRNEAEQKRRLELQKQIEERERKAAQQKAEIIQQRTLEMKQKRVDKERMVAQQKEQLEKEERERRFREDQRKAEIELKRREKEAEQREEERKRHEIFLAKQQEAEQRKQIEERERLIKLRQKEELEQKKREESEKAKLEQERMTAMILQHNKSLQHQAVANSFIKKQNAFANTSTASTSKLPQLEPDLPKLKPEEQVANMNSTFTLPKAAKADLNITQTISQIPKTNPVSYDISDLKSDEDTDDERAPRKPIPDWARGKAFVDTLSKQYGIARKYRERQIKQVFPEVELPVELDTIFKGAVKIVSSRYAKRTSSAHWSSPPAHALNLSMSFNSTNTSMMSKLASDDNSFSVSHQGK